jgi:hypothetical protein
VTPAHAAGSVDVTVTNASGTSATSPADKFTFTTIGAAMWACSNGQYWLTGNDGATWVVMDGTYLSVTFYVPTADSYAIIGGNADLWTQVAGINQDLGIQVFGGTGYPTTQGQPEAWKESGGSGGTYSPNAAFVQTVLPVKFDNTYTVRLQWKTNVATSGTIFAGAGPTGGKFSNTCITVRLVLKSAASVGTAVSTTQYTLTGNNGSTWKDIDATNLSILYTSGTATGFLVVGGNSDLWTNTAGYNQDIAINVNGGISAWKESGGFAGTFSPNAAFVQTVIPVAANTDYLAKLQWKTNINDPNTIYAGAGSGPKYSPTSITVLFLPTGNGTAPQDKVSTLQYNMSGNDGSTWVALDLSKFTMTYTPTNSCEVFLSANVDLWTSLAGYNQDIGILVTDTGLPSVYGQPEAWKESGGFNGTYSPNAAYAQIVVPMKAGVTYSIQLVWKANKADPGTIWAGAGSGPYSPTRLTLQPVGC